MRGLISMNFIDNGNITNEYPVVLYYNGDETNIISSIIDNEEISQFIYRKFINIDSYPKTVIYAVTYFADNGLWPVTATGVVVNSQEKVIASGLSLIVAYAFSEGRFEN